MFQLSEWWLSIACSTPIESDDSPAVGCTMLFIDVHWCSLIFIVCRSLFDSSEET